MCSKYEQPNKEEVVSAHRSRFNITNRLNSSVWNMNQSSLSVAVKTIPANKIHEVIYSYVRSSVRHVQGIYHKVFHRVAWKFLKWGISHKPFIFGPWVPWKVYFLTMSFGPMVHVPGRGWWSKYRTPLNSVLLLFCFGNTFTVQWFCLVSWLFEPCHGIMVLSVLRKLIL